MSEQAVIDLCRLDEAYLDRDASGAGAWRSARYSTRIGAEVGYE